MTENSTVALLGAGIMANTVAHVLHERDVALRRYNRTTSAITGPGCVCASPAQAADGASVVWSFVHDDDASRSVWAGRDGALAVAEGAVVIESSTLSVGYADQWSETAKRAGARPVYAAVTGSRAGVENAGLIAFTAGSRADRAAADPILRVITAEVLAFDSAGQAATVKLLNNAVAAVILTGLAETLATARSLGLDTAALVRVWSRHGWAAPVASGYGTAMITGQHQLRDCSLAVIAKDLRYTLDTTDPAAAPLIAAATRRFEAAIAAGLGGQEMSAIIQAYEATG
ncbi:MULTISPECIES: NAD(P)-dependent oxidoreductase [Nocardia]|uniref:NAD(P)-dependent oxidoreductase n=1 Tax=Nocardia TaxID=1817 RepID=UPI00030FD2CC|nr:MULTISPECIES: NAD(P)-binding domain-containing protein [Nocardia]